MTYRRFDPDDDIRARHQQQQHQQQQHQNHFLQRRRGRRSLSRLGRRSLSRTHGGRASRKTTNGIEFKGVGSDGRASNRWMGWWPLFFTTVTCCCPNVLLSKLGGMHQASSREAWREKVALCIAIAILCGALAFLTFGFSIFVCQPPTSPVWKLDIVRKATDPKSRRYFIVHGQIYNIPENEAKKLHPHSVDVFKAFATQDISPYFPSAPTCPNIKFACRSPGSSVEHCHTGAGVLDKLPYIGEVAYEWKDVEIKNSPFVVYNGQVIDLSVYLDQVPADSGDKPFGSAIDRVLREHLGKDASKALSIYDKHTLDCIFEHFRAGLLDVKTIGCVATDIVLYVSLVVILSLVFTKFFLAVGFAFVMSRRLGKPGRENSTYQRSRRGSRSDDWDTNENNNKGDKSKGAHDGADSGNEGNLLASTLKSSRYASASAYKRSQSRSRYSSNSDLDGNNSDTNSLDDFNNDKKSKNNPSNTNTSTNTNTNANSSTMPPPLFIKERLDSTNSQSHMYTILLVTCYSEGEEGLRLTLDSLTSTTYDDSQKLLFVVADGIIKGSGNEKSTPDILIDMMEMANELFEPYYFDADGHPIAHSYVALADGTKRHNMARVYAGYYRSGLHKIPMILVVKCGTPLEADKAKPGNRGKRDSQIIIMSFLNKCLFDDRMTPLDFDLFYKITRITGGVTPDTYELILMVDADTKVMPSALAKLVQVMRSDEQIMGCCGETRIANKAQSWVTAIQVFEYYISHHLSKAFESIFGGVTCLPGCFCMYRIKAPKGGQNQWVPIVANPDIVDAYSENVTDTLHKRNLLLLGEDRYLTTLMLKTFPRRKLIFVPQAICKTLVPDEFRVLLSQRRRWINSTVHNLFELVQVNDLCGTFCCSMQFVVFIELIGTLVLPAAITFTGVLIASTFMSDPQWIPLFLLAAILGLPAFLILFTARHPIYLVWFIIYLVALPIWNFVLPVYAYWHMDDFSWGETRKVEGVVVADDHGKKEGTFDSSHIYMKRWHEFEAERMKKIERFVSSGRQSNSEFESEYVEVEVDEDYVPNEGEVEV